VASAERRIASGWHSEVVPKQLPPGSQAPTNTGQTGLPTRIAQAAARHLTECIGQGESACEPAPLFGAEAEGLLHAGFGNGEADAVPVGDDRKEGEKNQDAVADCHAQLLSHAVKL
jgi:hypothetical protein